MFLPGKETDDCQLLTKTGLVTVHSQTASQCQQLCLRMSNCMGMMTFTKKGAMQPQVQSNTALPNQALCTPLGLEGRALETESRTCNDCFHRCRMMDKCSGLIFNNTLLFRYEMYTCETTKPWQRQPDDASYLLSEALLLPSRKLLRSDTLPS